MLPSSTPRLLSPYFVCVVVFVGWLTLLRPLPPAYLTLCRYLTSVKESFATCSALDLTEHAWQQAQLGLRYGGLGFRSLALHACAVYIASISSSGFADVDNQHLKHAVSIFNCLVSTQDTILIGST